MRDVELYRHLLGLEAPWTVARVERVVEAHVPKSPAGEPGVSNRAHDADG